MSSGAGKCPAAVGGRGQMEGGGYPREITVLAPPDVASAQVSPLPHNVDALRTEKKTGVLVSLEIPNTLNIHVKWGECGIYLE